MSVWQSLFNTAAEVYEPHSWWGLAGLIVIGLPTTIGATFAGLNWLRGRGTRREVNDTRQEVKEIKRQVVNGQTEPMRVELDRYFAGVHERLDGHAFAIETLTNRVETLAERRLGDRRQSDEPHDSERRSGGERRAGN